MTPERTRANANGPRSLGRRRGSGSWLVATTMRRTRAQWRLLVAVAVIATLSSSLVVSLGLLVTATEQGGVRGALASIPSTQSTLEVRVLGPHGSVADARAAADGAIDEVLGRSATTSSAGIALSNLDAAPALDIDTGPTSVPALAYFGELDDIEAHATLTDGAWPQDASSNDAVSVALPSAAAKALRLTVGSTFAMVVGSTPVTVTIVGLYKADKPNSHYWSRDTLTGRGNDPSFPKPNVSFYAPTNAFGPLIVAPGALASAAIPVSFIDVEYHPDFSRSTADQLEALRDRIATADSTVIRHIGTSAQSAYFGSSIADAVGGVATGLAVTRSTVVVVSLLLVVLAIAAMAQTARLFTDARAGERQLLRSRGASGGQLFALAALEACLIGAVTACASPPMAALVYRLLAAQPAMVAAGMPAAAGMPPLSWATAAGIAVVFVIVLLLPLLRRSRTFVEAEQSKGRQHAASALMRSGVDLVLVVLAGVAVWQLASYRSPVDTSGSLALDPVLVAGPALVLLAGTLVCMRLIPAASRLVQRLASRSRGIAVPLAAWEIGRRAQRATAAVLLLSLTLAVGAFGISFLSTWRQAQVDQASLAVGPPVRVSAYAGATSTQASALTAGAVGEPQPVIRRVGHVSGFDSGSTDASGGARAQVLALTPTARALIDRGRLSEEGGSRITALLQSTAKPASGIELPGDVRGVVATIQTGSVPTARAGVAANMSALIEDGNGLLSSVSLGRVDVDGLPHAVYGLLARAEGGRAPVAPVRFVGLQASFVETDETGETAIPGTATAADILLKDLTVLHPSRVASPTLASPDATASEPLKGSDYPSAPVAVDTKLHWTGFSASDSSKAPATTDVPDGWQLRLGAVIPPDVQRQPAMFALLGWTPDTAVPAVISQDLADSLHLSLGSLMSLRVQGAALTISVSGTTPRVPGAATADELSGGGAGVSAATNTSDTVVLDQALLARALAEAGVTGAMVDEWWVDVPMGKAKAYLAALHAPPGTAPPQSTELLGLRMQQAPLRVATQAALWLAIAASALLAAVGFAVHSTATLRARRLELAQLRAIGFSRRGLVALVGAESLLMCVLGTVFGISIGLLLVWLVGPLVAISPDGTPPVPSVIVQIPWGGIALLVALVAAVLAAVVLVVARVQRFAEPADLLRAGGEP